jgi:hypothetical protein
MGHPEVLLDQDWKLAQLIFLFDHGLCEVSYIGVELARKCFYIVIISIILSRICRLHAMLNLIIIYSNI